MKFPVLESERLILRGFTLADAPAVRMLAGEREIADTTLSIPHPYEEGVAEQWIKNHKETFEQGYGAQFAITRKSDTTLIGAISLMNIEAGHQAELGYWIGVPYWNMGYCTEAGELVKGFAFDQLGLVRLHARHLSRNPASGQVLKKLGFAHEGTRIGHARKWDRLENVEDYGLLSYVVEDR